MTPRLERLRSAIINVPDFPKPGIIFKDITPLFSDSSLFQDLISELASPIQGLDFNTFVAVESRGFILGAALAQKLNKGLVLVRKKNKLPRERFTQSYQLEYGIDTLEMHKGDLKKGQKTILIDDVLATGGTALAAAQLIQSSDTELTAYLFLIELEFLNGREKILSMGTTLAHSLIRY